MTKRGAAAQRFYNDLLSLPLKDLKPGMKVYEVRISPTGDLVQGRFVEVTAIEDNNITKRGGAIRNYGQADQYTDYSGLNLITVECTYVGVSPETMYRVAASKEQKQEAIAKALAYQDTLTKTGTVRKTIKK